MSTRNATDFAELLQKQRDIDESMTFEPGLSKHINDMTKQLSSEKMTSEKGASISDFIDMVDHVVTRAMKKDGVKFCADEGARIIQDQWTQVNSPVITFDLLERVPNLERKPRIRDIKEAEKVPYENGLGRGAVISAQKFTCIIQFNIFACDYKTANMVMNGLEELIFRYTAYFKKNGVAEILFQRQLTDRSLDLYRQYSSVRSLQYRVDIEKFFVQYKSETNGILVNQ